MELSISNWEVAGLTINDLVNIINWNDDYTYIHQMGDFNEIVTVEKLSRVNLYEFIRELHQNKFNPEDHWFTWHRLGKLISLSKEDIIKRAEYALEGLANDPESFIDNDIISEDSLAELIVSLEADDWRFVLDHGIAQTVLSNSHRHEKSLKELYLSDDDYTDSIEDELKAADMKWLLDEWQREKEHKGGD